MEDEIKSPCERILLADDDPEIISILEHNLDQFGYEYDSAPDGLKALEMLKKRDYAVGIYDILMPRMDGIELLAKTTEINPDMQVIMVTGVAQIGMVIETLKRGAFSFIRKPFDLEDLISEIRKALKQRQLEIENRNYRINLEQLVEKRTSELRKSKAELSFEKEKLENVLKSMGAGLQVLNSGSEIIFSNRIAMEWFGRMDNWRCFILSQSMDSSLGKCEACPVFKSSEPHTRSFTMKCIDAAIREFQMNCSPIRDRDGNVIQAVSLIQDVSERNRLERELIHSERLASMGEIAAGLAHEINNPIGVILGLVQNILAEMETTHPYHEDLKIIENETFRTSRVIKSLLEFAHEPAPLKKEINMLDVCKSSLEFLDYLFKENNITIKFNAPPYLPKFLGDPEQLNQVIVNILLNSLHAMSDGGSITFDFELEMDSAEDRADYLRIEIKDTGTGIAAEEMENVFKPFFTKKGKKGTGLGLSISKRIIEGHGGIISLQSKLGEGTTCIIELPI